MERLKTLIANGFPFVAGIIAIGAMVAIAQGGDALLWGGPLLATGPLAIRALRLLLFKQTRTNGDPLHSYFVFAAVGLALSVWATVRHRGPDNYIPLALVVVALAGLFAYASWPPATDGSSGA